MNNMQKTQEKGSQKKLRAKSSDKHESYLLYLPLK